MYRKFLHDLRLHPEHKAQNKDNLPLYEMRFSYGSPKIVLVFENKAVGSELKQWLPT